MNSAAQNQCNSLDTVKTGVLLLYTGSPAHPDPACVAAYLREFLMDPRVMEMPHWLRSLLVKGVIVPLRARKSAARYRSIWTPEGSPLTLYTHHLRDALQTRFPERLVVSAAAYGGESFQDSMALLLKNACRRILAFPLFPHYARATRGSVRAGLDDAMRCLNAGGVEINEVRPFYAHPAYSNAMCQVAAPLLEQFNPDHVVFSYHGLPLRQAYAPPEDGGDLNYEQQCSRGTAVLARALHLDRERYSQAYQSRFGRGWLTPSTESVLTALAREGKRRVALIAPSFVTDCLETLEELDTEARKTFLNAGGVAFLRVPALNAHPAWVEAAADLIRETLHALG